MKNYFYRLLTITILSSLLLTPVLVKADVITITNPLEAGSFTELMVAIAGILFKLAVAIAPIFIIIAGFYFLTAAGEPAKINTAKTIILWTAIGLLVVICAEGIITLFQEVFMP